LCHESSVKIWFLCAAAYFLVARHIARNSAMPRIKAHTISIPLLFVGSPAARFPSSDVSAGASAGTAVGSGTLTSGADVTAARAPA
jgi:hypothetical protein